jgi:hypothetical protein
MEELDWRVFKKNCKDTIAKLISLRKGGRMEKCQNFIFCLIVRKPLLKTEGMKKCEGQDYDCDFIL